MVQPVVLPLTVDAPAPPAGVPVEDPSTGLSLAPPAPAADLPADWIVRDGVPIGPETADRLIIGPNGVYTVVIDPDPRPVTPESDGLWRAGERVTLPPKRALALAHRLRRQIADEFPQVFPYPLLAVAGPVETVFLGRLRVVHLPSLPEAVWTHPGHPLLRSERAALLAAVAPPA
jgi:hypothetical protein